jgi:hypothetical protein
MEEEACVIKFGSLPERTAQSWCGKKVWSHIWAYQSADHVAIALETEQTPVKPCIECLRRIVDSIGKAV